VHPAPTLADKLLENGDPDPIPGARCSPASGRAPYRAGALHDLGFTWEGGGRTGDSWNTLLEQRGVVTPCPSTRAATPRPTIPIGERTEVDWAAPGMRPHRRANTLTFGSAGRLLLGGWIAGGFTKYFRSTKARPSRGNRVHRRCRATTGSSFKPQHRTARIDNGRITKVVWIIPYPRLPLPKVDPKPEGSTVRCWCFIGTNSLPISRPTTLPDKV